jgi:hypothetical protein
LPAAPAQSGGIIGDLSSAANQLGVGQAIDLLKGVVMPGITQAMQNAAGAAAAAPAAIAANRTRPRAALVGCRRCCGVRGRMSVSSVLENMGRASATDESTCAVSRSSGEIDLSCVKTKSLRRDQSVI